jgi:hypothetical protein
LVDVVPPTPTVPSIGFGTYYGGTQSGNTNSKGFTRTGNFRTNPNAVGISGFTLGNISFPRTSSSSYSSVYPAFTRTGSSFTITNPAPGVYADLTGRLWLELG